jgi:hypothetical protein
MDTRKKSKILFFLKFVSSIQGGQAWFGPVLNSAVHVFMYAYYGLSVIPSLRDKLWWKKYITMFQLVSEKGFSIKSV